MKNFFYKVKSGDWIWGNDEWKQICPLTVSWTGGLFDSWSSQQLSGKEQWKKYFWNISLSRPLVETEQITLLFSYTLTNILTLNATARADIDIKSNTSTGDIIGQGDILTRSQIDAGSKLGNTSFTLTAGIQNYRLGMNSYINGIDGGDGSVDIVLTHNNIQTVNVGAEGSLSIVHSVDLTGGT